MKGRIGGLAGAARPRRAPRADRRWCPIACSPPRCRIAELMRLVAAEQDCCQFFRFAITVDTRGVALEVRAPEDALPIVESMFGVPSGGP